MLLCALTIETCGAVVVNHCKDAVVTATTSSATSPSGLAGVTDESMHAMLACTATDYNCATVPLAAPNYEGSVSVQLSSS